ncbi:MAG: hypothetical protein ACP5RC_11765, partial [Halothiobacillaceae bacterium]
MTLIALLLTLAGAYLLYGGRYPWDGGLLLTLGLLGLTRVLWQRDHPAPRLRPARRLPHPTRRASLRGLALLLSLTVAFTQARMAVGQDFTFMFLIWVLACGLFLVSLLPPLPWPLGDEARRHARGLGAFLALLLLALLVRVLALGSIPPIFSGDEGEMARAGYTWIAPPLD